MKRLDTAFALCPFCGHRPDFGVVHEVDGWWLPIWVDCTGCGIRVELNIDYKHWHKEPEEVFMAEVRRRALNRWNTRYCPESKKLKVLAF